MPSPTWSTSQECECQDYSIQSPYTFSLTAVEKWTVFIHLHGFQILFFQGPNSQSPPLSLSPFFYVPPKHMMCSRSFNRNVSPPTTAGFLGHWLGTPVGPVWCVRLPVKDESQQNIHLRFDPQLLSLTSVSKLYRERGEHEWETVSLVHIAKPPT